MSEEEKKGKRATMHELFQEGDYLKILMGRLFMYVKVTAVYGDTIIGVDVFDQPVIINMNRVSMMSKTDEKTFEEKKKQLLARRGKIPTE